MSIWTLCDFCSPTKTGVPGDIPTFPMVPDVTDFLFRLRFSIFFSTSSPPSRLPDALPYMYDSICAGSSLGTCETVSYTHLRAHETDSYLVCRLLLEKKKKKKAQKINHK